jgi:hypothetical protein
MIPSEELANGAEKTTCFLNGGQTHTAHPGVVLLFEVRQDKAREPHEIVSCRCLDRTELANVVVCSVSSCVPVGHVGVLAFETLIREPRRETGKVGASTHMDDFGVNRDLGHILCKG